MPATLDIPAVVAIPGGEATFYADGELTMRHIRGLELYGMTLVPVVARLVDEELEGTPAHLTDEEHGQMWRFNHLATLAYLKAWTLDRPLPASVEEVAALPVELRLALAGHAAKLAVARRAGFGINLPRER